MIFLPRSAVRLEASTGRIVSFPPLSWTSDLGAFLKHSMFKQKLYHLISISMQTSGSIWKPHLRVLWWLMNTLYILLYQLCCSFTGTSWPRLSLGQWPVAKSTCLLLLQLISSAAISGENFCGFPTSPTQVWPIVQHKKSAANCISTII